MVNQEIGILGLYIDESSLKDNGEYISFLDIQYCFDSKGELQTDLYIKETDSRSYLNFASAHPNYTFSGTVYSQCLRLRRIINNKERLQKRLFELATCFKKAGYPEKMVKNISNKVLNSQRNISVKEKTDRDTKEQIRVVTTYLADEMLLKAVKDCEESLRLTPLTLFSATRVRINAEARFLRIRVRGNPPMSVLQRVRSSAPLFSPKRPLFEILESK